MEGVPMELEDLSLRGVTSPAVGGRLEGTCEMRNAGDVESIPVYHEVAGLVETAELAVYMGTLGVSIVHEESGG